MSEHLRPDLLARYVSSGLSDRERGEVEAHLRGCPSCRGMLSVQRTFGESDARTIVGAPRGATEGAMTLPVRGSNPFWDEKTVTHDPNQDQRTTTARALPSGKQVEGTVPARPAVPTNPSRPFAVSHTAATHEDLPPVSSGAEALVGRKVGDYILEELVGKGGMAAVYRAVHPLIGKRVAVKVMLSHSHGTDFAARMIQEAQAVNAIDHPNIIEVLGAGTLADGRTYLVMQFLDGLPLSSWLREQEVDLSSPVILGVLEQLFSALTAAHRAGVIHRDIKPANVMLVGLDAPIPTVKVVDFGLAKAEDAKVTTSPDIVLGTPGFVAPEQIRGERATAASDLYSAGLVAYTVVTREEPYPRDEHAMDTLHRQLKEPPPPIAPRLGVPFALIGLISELTRINPLERPASASEVVSRLQAIGKSLTTGPAPMGTWVQPKLVPENATKPDRPATPRPRSSQGLSALRRDDPPREVADQPAPREPLAPSLSDLPPLRSKVPYVVLVLLLAIIATGSWFLLR